MDNFDEKGFMDPEKIIDETIKGLENNTLEIYPGLSKIIKIMSRIAPDFLLKQTSKAGANFYQNK